MQENRINKTGIFQPQFPTVKNQSSSILVENTIDKPGEGENLLMVANSTDNPTPANAAGLIPILTYGGVSVAVIIAMAWFVKILLMSISELLQTIPKNKK